MCDVICETKKMKDINLQGMRYTWSFLRVNKCQRSKLRTIESLQHTSQGYMEHILRMKRPRCSLKSRYVSYRNCKYAIYKI